MRPVTDRAVMCLPTHNWKGFLTVSLTSSTARQMRFNPWGEPVVLYNDVATKFTLLLLTNAACGNDKYASACSSHTHTRVEAVTWREHQKLIPLNNVAEARPAQDSLQSVGLAWSPQADIAVYWNTFPRPPRVPLLSLNPGTHARVGTLERAHPNTVAAKMYTPKPECVGVDLEVHRSPKSSMWSPVYYDYLPYSSSIHLKLDFYPRGNNIWKDFTVGCDFVNPWMQQITERNTGKQWWKKHSVLLQVKILHSKCCLNA